MVRLLLPALGFLAAAAMAPPAAAADLCLTTHDQTQRNVSVDCDLYDVWPNEWIGFTTGGTPCQSASPTDPGCLLTPETPVRYTWALSASSTDPYVNSAVLPADATLYLWILCDSNLEWNGPSATRLAGAEFAVTGSISVVSFMPWMGFLNVGSATQLQIVVGRITGPAVVGEFEVAVPTPVERIGWGRVKGTYR